MFPIAFIGSLGPAEMLFVGVIALLLFGKKLPEVARSMGKSLTEFKRGMSGIEDHVSPNSYSSSAHDASSNPRPTPTDETVETSAPKFEPPTTEPISESETSQVEK